MLKTFKRAGVVAALAAASLFAANPAQARDGYRNHDGGDDAAVAIVAGIAGLAIGAAIASDGDHHHYRGCRHDRGGRYYDRSYYRDGYYYRGDYPRYRYRDGYRYRSRHYDGYRDHHHHDRRYRSGW